MKNKAMLVASRNDVENMANFLINKCGFKPGEIQKCLTERRCQNSERQFLKKQK